MKMNLRAFARLAILALAAVPALASAQTGSISGQVTLTGQGSLNGVNVRVVEASRTTSTDRYGYYTVPSIPAGRYTIEFSYLGLENETREATVEEGQQTVVDVQFFAEEEVVQLDAMVVTSSVSSEARALNEQRTAETFANVVAADAFGRFPDQNAAEALARIPGIAIDRDQGEGRYVTMRGVDKNLTNFAIDGIQLASPKDDERAVLMDIVPSDVLQTLVVYKVTTPDQPGEGIGGYINIRTPSAFDAGETVIRLQGQGNYSDLAEKWGYRVNGSYGELFAGDTIGLMFAFSYDERDIASDNIEADPWEETDDGLWFTESIEYREYNLSRKRIGANVNLEWKPSDDQLLYLRGNFNQYKDHEKRNRVVMEFDVDGPASGSTPASTVIDASEGEIAVENQLKDRTETLTLMGVSGGGQTRTGQWTFDYVLSYSYADEDTPDDYEVTYAYDTDDAHYTYATNSFLPRPGYLDGPDYTDASLYEFDGIEDSDQKVEEGAITAQVDARYDLETDTPIFVKTGALMRRREKTNDVLTTVYEDPAIGEFLSAFATEMDYPFAAFPFVSTQHSRYFQRSRADYGLAYPDLEELVAGDFESNEDVLAAYIMGGVTLGEHTFEAGVRMEHTSFDTTGYAIDIPALEAIQDELEDGNDIGWEIADYAVQQAFKKDYTNWLPGLIYTYRPTDRMVVRGSVTNTIARPIWAQNSAYIIDEDGEAEAGNPDLDPYESLNLDASFEYYTDHLGMVYAAVFYKEISNFVYEQKTEDAEFNGVTYDELTTYRNGDSAYVMGIELAYHQLLTFLPDPMDGLGFLVNMTASTSDASYSPNDEDFRDIHLPGQSNLVYNVALTYEKYGFFSRVALGYRSKFLDELSEDGAGSDRMIKGYMSLDVSTSYRINPNWEVYANFINVTNEPFQAYYRGTNRIAQFEEYGMTVQFGAKWNY